MGWSFIPLHLLIASFLVCPVVSIHSWKILPCEMGLLLFHWYSIYQTNCNEMGTGFVWWLVQKNPRPTIQDNQDSSTTLSHLRSTGFHCKTSNRHSPVLLLYCRPFWVSFVDASLCGLCPMLCSLIDWHPEVSAACIGSTPYELEEPD